MNNDFELLIGGFLDTRVGVVDDFLSDKLSLDLISNLRSHYSAEELRLAGIGNKDNSIIDQSIRRDKIFWLDKNKLKASEKLFFELIDAFVIYLNRTCFTSIKSYEFHYALYDKGAFYKKHLNQFKIDSGRAFSMILYLNSGWIKEDGGQLKIYKETEVQLVSPENRKCVFFKSDELPHEVLVSNKSRMSIVGWLKTKD